MHGHELHLSLSYKQQKRQGHTNEYGQTGSLKTDGYVKTVKLLQEAISCFEFLLFVFKSELGWFKEKEIRMEKSALTTLNDKTLYKELSPTTVKFIPAND